MTTVEATNCHRTYVAKSAAADTDFDSQVIDFKDMPMGAVHIFWRDLTGPIATGSMKFFASNLPEPDSFDPDGTEIDGAEIVPHNTDGSRIWIRERIGFRYLMLRWSNGSISGGEIDIIAIGKKS